MQDRIAESPNVVGIPSDKLVPQGGFWPPMQPLPATGRYWNFRVWKAKTCDVRAVYMTFYEDGVMLYRAARPAIVDGYSVYQDRAEGEYEYRSVATTLIRMQMAMYVSELVDEE